MGTRKVYQLVGTTECVEETGKQPTRRKILEKIKRVTIDWGKSAKRGKVSLGQRIENKLLKEGKKALYKGGSNAFYLVKHPVGRRRKCKKTYEKGKGGLTKSNGGGKTRREKNYTWHGKSQRVFVKQLDRWGKEKYEKSRKVKNLLEGT